MTDAELGRIWAKHFPKSDNGHVSEEICRTICLIVEKKALLESLGGNLDPALTRVLERCGIPWNDFASCRNLTRRPSKSIRA